MNLLINESPLFVQPSLAKEMGLNEALVLQQLYFRSLIASKQKDGFSWVYKTYEEWQEEFPFWSVDTIKRTIRRLEKKGYVISTSAFNKMKTDKTKWYRIDYPNCSLPSVQPVPSNKAKRPAGEEQLAPCEEGNLSLPITKELKRDLNKEYVGTRPDVVFEVIDYLNAKTGKEFRAKSKSTRRMLNARLSEGYSLEDFKAVIDVKVGHWGNDPHMRNYLRPSTLFAPTNFENYLNEVPVGKSPMATVVHQSPVLDFGKGESR
ncbi:hypothetical protein OXB_2660 [Bacillus sp. OxB-1]|uniref:conserved phage C-terminal domain-containing protein n=1 Tax=Bacillus sp. (strain OxB-1) TaxID=98228 RepID=UPI0005822DDB|nr:conserved phage C-terminal domain-containing protein [Bacillus sp. OxB-1]BAQ11131.1 hypothetical protein OXB_2660 [Bacillus sp. OxB-1]